MRVLLEYGIVGPLSHTIQSSTSSARVWLAVLAVSLTPSERELDRTLQGSQEAEGVHFGGIRIGIRIQMLWSYWHHGTIFIFNRSRSQWNVKLLG